MKRAVFLDRDGVLNRLVLNPATGEYESPHRTEDFYLYPGTAASLRLLQERGYMLFLVSNQPSYAKGKTSLENIEAIHALLHEALIGEGVAFKEYYYCYHHPQGIVPGYSGSCACRKPGAYFLEEAKKRYGYSAAGSWMVGDQDSDILCGRSCGLRTILIESKHSALKRGAVLPDYRAADLQEAVKIIVECTGEEQSNERTGES